MNRENCIRVLTTDEEKALIQEASRMKSLGTSTFMRVLAIQESKIILQNEGGKEEDDRRQNWEED